MQDLFPRSQPQWYETKGTSFWVIPTDRFTGYLIHPAVNRTFTVPVVTATDADNPAATGHQVRLFILGVEFMPFQRRWELNGVAAVSDTEFRFFRLEVPIHQSGLCIQFGSQPI
ncbi:MAG TPA: hypothetical protein VLF67_03270 [Candidatus Saccharimonas sp.]|nr:hypothetical protein [Candidatus Saccharimonas sp.]